MRRVRASEFEAFLRLVDEELSKDSTIVIVGGAAIGLAYAPDHSTTDIDVMPTRNAALWKAVERANARSKVSVPFQAAGIVQPPYEYEDRLRPLPIQGLKHLKVLVPERHDLALMKVARGEAHDLAGIEDIHRASPLSLGQVRVRAFEFLAEQTQHLGEVLPWSRASTFRHGPSTSLAMTLARSASA